MEIPLSIDSNLNNFKLLEIPSSILASLSSDKTTVLHIKSEISPPSSGTLSAPTAVLCTEDETFELRQVQSSNILHVLHTANGDTSSSSGLSAIAECRDLLELVPKETDILPYLRKTLPACDDAKNVSTRIRTPDLFANTPFSDSEIREGLASLCVIEEDGCSWIPAAGVLKSVWTSLVNSTTLEGTSIDKGFDFDDIKSLVLEDGCSAAVFDAVVRRISPEKGRQGKVSATSSKCTPWIGSVLLEAIEEPIQKEDFLAQWKDLLPEAWRADVDLNLIQGRYVDLEEEKITFRPYIENGVLPTATRKPSSLSKSKWHEKFKNRR